MLTVEYRNANGEWVKAVDKEWSTRRGVEHWLHETFDGARVRCRHEGRYRVAGHEERRRRPVPPADIAGWVKVGDVFHRSWGYDMVINEFYEVVAVSKSGKTVTVREIDTIMDGSPHDIGGCFVRPRLTGGDRFIGRPERHRVWLAAEPGPNGVRTCSIAVGIDSALLMEPEDYVRGFQEDHND